MNRAALGLPFVLVALSLSSGARASDVFPDEIKAQLMLDQAPLCTICHQTLIGGSKTVTKPFGIHMMTAHNLKAGDVAGLHKAISDCQAAGTDPAHDSDNDGIPNITELIQGTDPNVPEGGVAAEQPKFGCYCTAVCARPGFSAAGAAWLAALVFTSLRRKSAPRRHHERRP